MAAPVPQIFASEFAFESHFATIAGLRMHYLDEGSGPVVMLLHGNPTWSFYYRHLVKALSPSFRVIVPDYLGCGLSDHPTDVHFRASHRIDHLEELLRHLGITRFSLVMHDWGGAIGTGLAVRQIEAVEKLVYLNTTLTETESLPQIIKTAARPIIGKFLTKHSKRFLKMTTGFGVAKPLSREVCAGYYFPYATRARRTAIWDFVADIPFDSDHPSYADMLDLAGKIPLLRHVPVQIVWGLKDPCFHREMLNKVASHFPQAQIFEISNASHLVLEDAREVANNRISAFLREPVSENQHDTIEEIQSGQPAVRSNNGARSLVDFFLERALENPQGDACVVPTFLGDTPRYLQVNARELRALIYKYQRGLKELGLVAGDKVIMLVSPGVDFVALTYAIIARGAIPVFLDPGMGRENLVKSIKACDAQAFIGSPKAQILRWLKPKVFRHMKFHLTASEWFYAGGPTLRFLKRFASSEIPSAPCRERDTAFIAFTSGATGMPKGVVFDHGMVAAQLDIFRTTFGLEAGNKDLPLLPIFSIFTVALGVCSVFAPMDVSKPLALNAQRVVKVINDLGIQYSFGSPTLWNKISEYCVRSGAVLSTLKKVFMAGAPVPRITLQRLQDILTSGESFTPYGSTEALPVTLISAHDILEAAPVTAAGGEQGTLIGHAIPNVELRIVDAKDEEYAAIPPALPPGKIGEIVVRGKNVSASYLSRPEATALAKIPDGEGFWHRMGDLGYLDSKGDLYFCGRKAHAVSMPARMYYSIPTERIFNMHHKVRRSALVRLGAAGVAIVIEPFPQFWPETEGARMEFKRELLALARTDALTASIDRFFFHASFPVDGRHNAKIFRDKLGEWATAIAAREGRS